MCHPKRRPRSPLRDLRAVDARRTRRRPAAAMLVLVAVLFVIFIVMAVMSIDVAYMQLVRTELRAATDSAARAGAATLSSSQNPDIAVAAAIEAAGRNQVAGEPLELSSEEVVVGRSSRGATGRWVFSPGQQPYNAVRVNGDRTSGSAAGAVNLFVGRILGTPTFEPGHTSTATQLDREICLVMDRSGSMAWDLSGNSWSYPAGIPGYPDGYCVAPHATLSRWSAAASAVGVFLEELDNTTVVERVALVSYSSDYGSCGYQYYQSETNQVLTDQLVLINNAMTLIGTLPICGGTSIGGGIDEAAEVLTGENSRTLADKTMIVLTDGIHNNGRNPEDAAQDAADLGIVIHTVTFSDQAEQQRMQTVADIAGGYHYHAPDAERLREIFAEIARTLPIALTD